MELEPGYRQTEIGVIPDNWETVRVAEILTIRHGKNQSQVQVADGAYPILASGGEIGRSKSFLYDRPSVLIGRKGTIDKPQYMESPFWTVDTLFFSEISPNNFAKFVYYKFCSVNWRSFNEASGVPSLNAATIENIVVSRPPLKEQKAIAEALSDVDALIDSLEALLTKKRNIKTGVTQELLTGRTRLPGFTGDWQTKTLGSLLSYEQPTPFLVVSSDYLSFSSVPVLTAGKTFILGYTDEERGVYDSLPVILFDDFTTACQWVDFPFKVKSSAAKILSGRVGISDTKFMHEYLSRLSYVPSDHQRHWISIFSSIEAIVPPLKEQETISEVLSEMDDEIEALEKRLAKTRDLKQGMAQELLTGRTRLV